MPDDWRKIELGLFESADGRYRIANPYKLTTELRHRWLVAERRSSGTGWNLHHGDHATLYDARAYVVYDLCASGDVSELIYRYAHTDRGEPLEQTGDEKES